MKKIVIIGNGISGITAARHIRKLSDHEITVISAETDHFFSRTALMYIYMGHMKYENTKPYEDWFWEKNRINLVRDYVEKIDTDSKTLNLKSKGTLQYDKLILAVGSKPNKFGWPGQDLDGVQGMYSYQDLELLEKNTTDHKVDRAVIIGGGLIGIEMAEMLMTRGVKITFLIRESSYWNNVLPAEESTMVGKHAREHHIDLRENAELQEILADSNGRVKGILTKTGEEIPCQLVGLTVGVSPNIAFLKDSAIETERGIKINEYFETNIPDVYAIGDCAQFHEAPAADRRPIEQVWYTGRMHGETLARTICGTKTAYNPGIWFNSAKFMDIEYQIYGQVSARPREEEDHIYWEHESGKKSIRLVYKKETNEIVGFNLMGIRYRHEVCNQWLKEKRSLKEVVSNLLEANFDQEFHKTHEHEIVGLYNQRFPNDPVSLKKKGMLAAIFA